MLSSTRDLASRDSRPEPRVHVCMKLGLSLDIYCKLAILSNGFSSRLHFEGKDVAMAII